MTATHRTPAERERRRRQAAAWRANNGYQPRPPRLFDIGPLIEAIAARDGIGLLDGQARTAAENRVLGLHRARRRDYALQGLTAYVADQLAITAGYHPAELYGDAWWAAADLEEAVG